MCSNNHDNRENHAMSISNFSHKSHIFSITLLYLKPWHAFSFLSEVTNTVFYQVGFNFILLIIISAIDWNSLRQKDDYLKMNQMSI